MSILWLISRLCMVLCSKVEWWFDNGVIMSIVGCFLSFDSIFGLLVKCLKCSRW